MSFILLVEQAAPETPSANQVVLYPKSDGLVYSKDDTGTERAIAQGIATQAQQETGTDTAVAVTPGRQHFHPSAAKGWVKADVAGGVTVSYNVTSAIDNGTGDVTINWATDFSSADFSTLASIQFTFGGSAATTLICNITSVAAGSTRSQVVRVSDGVAVDPTNYHIIAFGDHV